MKPNELKEIFEKENHREILDKLLKENGWCPYYGDSWFKKEWADEGLPYDRMAVPFEEALRQTIKEINRKY